MNGLTLWLTVWLGSECSSWAQPATAFPLLLPNVPSFTGSIRASTLNCSVWTYLLPGLVQMVFLTAPVWSSSHKTKQKGSLWHRTATVGRVLQSKKQGDGGCSDVAQGLQDDGLPCAEPIREVAWQLAAGRLLEAFFLASREINPSSPFLLGNALEACLSLLQGTWG